jgi:hydroxymethylbilane synthase
MIVFGTRGSDLALTQTRQVAQTLAERTGVEYRIEVLETRGDRELDKPLPEIGGKGLFTAELEAALLEGRIDVAVHSLKDLPVEEPAELTLGAIPERADPRDVLVYDPAIEDEEGGSVPLREDARLGSSSPRRRGALLCLKPLLDLVDVRGNVPTRIRKVADGVLHATLLAAAGLERLERGGVDLDAAGLGRLRRLPLDPRRVPPAPGQGALAVQCRRGDARVLELLASLEHAETRAAATAERQVLQALGGGCSMPFGALATKLDDGRVRMVAALFTTEDVRPVGAVFVDEVAASFEDVAVSVTEALRPFAGEPLAGTRIAVLRPAGGDGRLDGGLRVAGAELDGITTADIEPVFPDGAALREGLADGVLVFSSARGVDRFCEIAAFESGLLDLVRRVYAVGPSTAEAAVARGLPDVRQPTAGAGGRALAEHLARETDAPRRGSRVLHVGAEDPHPALGEGLRSLGLDVAHAAVYRLVAFDEVDPPNAPVDAALFASPSAVRVWANSADGLPSGARAAIALGTSTAEAMQAAGLPPTAVLDTPTPSELVRALRDALGR